MTTDLPELRKRLITGAVWSVLIADHHADTLTPRQIERLYDASNAMRKADAALQKLAELEAENAPKYASECGDAAQAYIRELWGYERYARNMNTLPATFRWYECFDRMVAAARPLPSPPKGDVA